MGIAQLHILPYHRSHDGEDGGVVHHIDEHLVLMEQVVQRVILRRPVEGIEYPLHLGTRQRPADKDKSL